MCIRDRTKALNEEGITAYCLTGAYDVPSPTVTGSLKDDVAFISEILGVKGALSDHRSGHPSLEQLIHKMCRRDRLYAVPEDYAINTPYVVAGTLPDSGREIAVSDQLAAARGLQVGDWYELTVTGTGRQLRLYICGLIKDPECMYLVNATNPAPDLSRYAFAYGTEELLSDFMGANRYNQICCLLYTSRCV